MYAGHDVGVARLADADDASVADADVGLDDARHRIDDGRVLDDDIEDCPTTSVPVDALAVAQVLAGADQQLVAVDGVVVLDFGEQLGISETDEVALGRAVGGGIGAADIVAIGSGSQVAGVAGPRPAARPGRPGVVAAALRQAGLAADDAVPPMGTRWHAAATRARSARRRQSHIQPHAPGLRLGRSRAPGWSERNGCGCAPGCHGRRCWSRQLDPRTAGVE